MTFFYLAGREEPGFSAGAAAAVKEPARAAVRIGFTVPRALGGAVERNRIRRRMREAVRHNYQSLLAELNGTMDVVINPRKSVLKADFARLSQEVVEAFARLRQSAGFDTPAGAATARDRRRQSEVGVKARGSS
jgi:ribonuclease P protein component